MVEPILASSFPDDIIFLEALLFQLHSVSLPNIEANIFLTKVNCMSSKAIKRLLISLVANKEGDPVLLCLFRVASLSF